MPVSVAQLAVSVYNVCGYGTTGSFCVQHSVEQLTDRFFAMSGTTGRFCISIAKYQVNLPVCMHVCFPVCTYVCVYVCVCVCRQVNTYPVGR